MEQILNILLLLAVALATKGVINRTRALLSGRKGPRFVQHLLDIKPAMMKHPVYSHTTTVLFRLAPAVYLASAVVAMLMVPAGNLRPVLSFDGDMIAFAYVLAAGRLAIVAAAMDTGSPFAGMGASRETLYGLLAEPALMMIAATLALAGGHTSFGGIFSQMPPARAEMTVVLLLTAYLTLRLWFVESGRVPVDDPRTHLELTMVHEAMCLDYCGADLAMIQIAGWLKSASFAMIAADAALAPAGCPWWIAAPAAAIVTGVAAGVVESTQARNKLARNATFIMTITALAALALLVGYLLQHDIMIQ